MWYCSIMMKATKPTNKELFYAYAKAFGLKACRGLPDGQHIALLPDDAHADIIGSFETTHGAYTKGKPIFVFRLYITDDMYDDNSRGKFTREQVEAAIASGTALHDTQPDRGTK